MDQTALKKGCFELIIATNDRQDVLRAMLYAETVEDVEGPPVVLYSARRLQRKASTHKF
jgi:hypothetical protein